jgi:hypothetical protein
MSTAAEPYEEHSFRRPTSSAAKGTLFVFGGIGGMCFALVGFAISVFGRTGLLGLQFMVTFPVILTIGALAAGWRLLRAPHRVVVSSEGILIERETQRLDRFFHWDEIGSTVTETGGMSHRRFLNITDLAGRSLIRLDQSFEGFDEMVALVSRHVAAKGDDTSRRIHRKKSRRRAALAFAIGLLILLASGFIASTTHEDLRAARLLREKGEPGEGEIVRRIIAPDGWTKRLEYRVTGAGGRMGTRDVEVERGYWDELEHEKSIPVIYVPDEPEISRLARGEVKEVDFTKTPLGGYGIAALAGLVSFFMLAIAPLAWNGWDLALDPKTKKWSVKQFGEVVGKRGDGASGLS